MLPSYPQILAVGHRYLEHLLEGDVVVEEKVDGSQLSFGCSDPGGPGLQMRSKGQDQTDAQDKLFEQAWDAIKFMPLTEGWTYRGEYLSKPRHNVLAYDRTPLRHIVLFDVETIPGTFLSPEAKHAEATRLGMECVPLLYQGELDQFTLPPLVQTWLKRQSFLGGQLIEGVVVKNYNRWGLDGKVLIGKYVSAAFKESHKEAWPSNPGADFIDALAKQYRTEARWNKAIQHLRDDGLLVDAPQDIGPLLKEINRDILEDSRGEISEALFEHFWKQIGRQATAGFPQWYKERVQPPLIMEIGGAAVTDFAAVPVAA